MLVILVQLIYNFKRDSIYIWCLAERKIMNEIGIEHILTIWLKKFFKFNESVIIFNNLKLKLHVILLICDNFGANELLKITKSFISKSYKYCKVSYRQLQEFKNLS